MVSPDVKPFIRASRGSHIVVSTDHFGGKTGMFIPKTSDGRVLFCIPWHGVLEIGTTDKEEKDISFNPEPTEEEIEFMLETARKYLAIRFRARTSWLPLPDCVLFLIRMPAVRRSCVQRALGHS